MSTPPAQVQPDTDYSGLLAALSTLADAPLSVEKLRVTTPGLDMRPTVLEVVRMCPPSGELVDLLTKLTLEHLQEGKTDLASELLGLALCARSARRNDRPFG